MSILFIIKVPDSGHFVSGKCLTSCADIAVNMQAARPNIFIDRAA